MALIHCQFYSEVLHMSTSMTVILPQQTNTQIGMKGVSGQVKYKTLYLLHGFSDDDTIWTRRTSIERYVSELGLAVIMPNVHHSFYTNMEYGGKYWTFLTEELPAIASSFFPLSSEREDNFVAGLSMGGYGAFKWALRHPEKFAAAGSLSGVVDIVQHLSGLGNPAISKAFHLIYGDKKVEGTDDDLLAVLKRGKENNQRFPQLFQTCGKEDFLYEGNINFRDVCRELNVELTYEEWPGEHNWQYWDDHIQRFLNWLPLQGQSK